jgi:hypothetical protein
MRDRIAVIGPWLGPPVARSGPSFGMTGPFNMTIMVVVAATDFIWTISDLMTKAAQEIFLGDTVGPIDRALGVASWRANLIF